MAITLADIAKWMRWTQIVQRFKKQGDELKQKFSLRSIIGLILLLYAFIPDTASRLSYWQGLYREYAPLLSKVYTFALTGGGRLIMMVVGLGIIWWDHKAVLKHQHPIESPVTTSDGASVQTGAPGQAQPVSQTKEDEQPPLTLEECWVEKCNYDAKATSVGDTLFTAGDRDEIAIVDFAHNNFDFPFLHDISAKLTYYDSNGKPYRSVERATWRDELPFSTINRGKSDKLVVAVLDITTGRVLLPVIKEAGDVEQIELRKGNGFVVVRLDYKIGSYDGTGIQKHCLSLRTSGKNLKIEKSSFRVLESS